MTQPDPALRPESRRRRPGRVAAGLGALTAAALVVVPTILWSGDDDARQDHRTAVAPTPTGSRDASSSPSARPDRGSLRTPQGRVAGEWESEPPRGEVLVVGTAGRFEEVFYATSFHGHTVLARGLRDGDRLLRTMVVFGTVDVADTDDIVLYGGDVLGLPGDPVDTTGGRYLVLGLVRGDADLTVTYDGTTRAVVRRSTEVAPGFTAFYDAADWQDGWSPIELAPLRIRSSTGARADVRRDSWTG